jgi:hypothetical protein
MPDQNAQTPLSGRSKIVLGAYLLLVTVLLAYATIAVWPSWEPGAGPGASQGGSGQAGSAKQDQAKQDQAKQDQAKQDQAKQDQANREAGQAASGQAIQGVGNNETINVFGISVFLSHEAQLILLVLVVGALGGCIHGATSFAAFAGNENLHASWVWYYLLRAPISATLALVAYFAVRGGFFSAGGITNVNFFGIAALAGLVGMFSKQATAKLDEVFSTLFRTSTQPPLGGQLTNKVPTLSSVNPTTIPHSNGDTTLTLTGDGFVEKSEARWAGAALTTQFVKAGQLTATVPAGKLVAAGSFDVTVFNPAPGGGTSTAVKVTVT